MGVNQTQHHPVKTMSDLWLHSDVNGLKCPLCKGDLILFQLELIEDYQNPYHTYDTLVECMSCQYKFNTVSYTILGSVDQYDDQYVTIYGWSPSGSRVETIIEHLLDYQLLKELQQSAELVEFLIVDNHAIEVIG